ncbi:von Willebrand factor [Cladophialophora carrionii]|uniref:von Willebrand factor n=1 Tax=Cladophialophora carrionii TaxID=86049 RepID=A0A1C1CNV8_9EURO|nr:von Willebrand factor [Cladophialophora carrionii]
MDRLFRKFSNKSQKSSNGGSNASQRQSPIATARRNMNTNNPFTTTVPTRRPAAPEPPPPYSPPASTSASASAAHAASSVPFSPADLANTMQTGDDSPYAFLRTFDTIFLIDDSGSMAGRSWRETSSALAAIAPICTAHDPDGIDVYFLNHRNPHSTHGGYTNLTTPGAVQSLFQNVRPLGGTPTGTRLNQILKPYLAELADSLERQAHGHDATVKPLNMIVITDGVPSDDVESVIVSAARKLDSMAAEPWQVGVQFFQVGREPEARDMLQELDDALSGEYHIRDMVDTVPWSGDDGDEGLTGQGLLKVCLGSVVRRWDRRQV